MKPLIVEEDVVVLMIVLQDLEQGFLGFGARPRKCMGAQNRGRKPCRRGKKSLEGTRGMNFGSSRLTSSE